MGLELNHKKDIVALYKILEDDIITTSQHVHLHENNLKTFSLRLYNELFLSANIFERCCRHIENNKKHGMNKWKVNPEITRFSNESIRMIQMDYEFQPLLPFSEADEKKRILPWWQAYNNVKHSLTNLDKASLKNVLDASASAGILISRTCLHAPGGVEMSKLFRDIHIPTFHE